MPFVSSLVASVVMALLLVAGFTLIERQWGDATATLGAAVAVGVLAAFLLAYDIAMRAARPDAPAPGGRRGRSDGGPIRPRLDHHELLIVDAAPREKDAVAHINAKTESPIPKRPAVLRVRLGPGRRYERDHLRYQANTLYERHPLHPVVYFVLPQDRFFGFADARDVIKVLDTREGNGVIELINNGVEEQLAREPWLRQARLPASLSARDALKQLAAMDQTRAMIVNDRTQRWIGLVDWASLVERLFEEKVP